VNVLPGAPDCEGCEAVTVGFGRNVAVTVMFAVREKVQTAFALPAQAPDQPMNKAFELGTAVSMIDVPAGNDVPEGAC
jgi:hypothetical protein